MPNETTTEDPGVKNLLQWFAEHFEAFLDWLAKVLGDSTLRRAALRDLGLTPATGGSVPDEDAIKRQLEGHLPAVQAFATAEAEKVDAVAVAAFIDSIVQVANVIVTIIEASTEDDAVGAAEMVLAFFELFAVRQLRYHQPATFALGQAVTVINERAGFVDWRRLGALIGITPEDDDAVDEDEDEGFLAAEQDAFAISQIVGSVVAIGAVALQERFDLGENIEFLYGWDPDVRPGGPTVAERVAARTLTLRVGVGEAKGAVTIALVPGEHGGPGMVVGIGGNLELTEPATAGAADDALRATLKLTGDAAAVYVPFDGDLDATIMGAGEFSAAWVAPARPGAKPYVVGPERGSRLEIGSGGMDVRLSADGFRIQFAMRDSAVVIASGDGDAFIGKALAARATRLPFDLVLGYDTRTGFFIEGGTGLSTTLPVNLSDPFDLLRVQHVHLALRAPGSGDARALTLEASAAVRLGRGLLQLSLDRIGFEAALDFSGPELDRDSFSIGFKPPSGVGVAFDAEWLKGGGYCYYDPERDEYAGVFEARIVSVTVKVFVIYTRKFPPDAEGREVDENSVFIAGSAQFRVALTGNFFWTGVGVLGGNNRGVAIEALRKGLTTKALDDVLFPDDPVANAPRILQTLRTVFPLTLDSSVFGVLLELSWGTPTVARLRLGVILQLAEARDRVTLLGQFKVRAPDEKVKAKAIQLNLDFIGDLVWKY